MAFNRQNNPPPPAALPAANAYTQPIPAPPSGAYAPSPAAAPRNIYSGIAIDDRDPMLDVGTYRLKITDCVQGHNPEKHRTSYKVSAIVEANHAGTGTPVGANIVVIFSEARKGLADLKSFTMAAASCGVTLEDLARGTTQDGTPIRAAMAAAQERFDALENEYGGPGSVIMAALTKAPGVPNAIGESVDCVVARGKDVITRDGVHTGDFYRQYRWAVAQ